MSEMEIGHQQARSERRSSDLPNSSRAAHPYNFPQPLRSLVPCCFRSCVIQSSLPFPRAGTDPERKICSLDGLHTTFCIDLKSFPENLPSLREFGAQFLAGLSLAQKFISSIVVCIQPNADEYLGQSA